MTEPIDLDVEKNLRAELAKEQERIAELEAAAQDAYDWLKYRSAGENFRINTSLEALRKVLTDAAPGEGGEKP